MGKMALYCYWESLWSFKSAAWLKGGCMDRLLLYFIHFWLLSLWSNWKSCLSWCKRLHNVVTFAFTWLVRRAGFKHRVKNRRIHDFEFMMVCSLLLKFSQAFYLVKKLSGEKKVMYSSSVSIFQCNGASQLVQLLNFISGVSVLHSMCKYCLEIFF